MTPSVYVCAVKRGPGLYYIFKAQPVAQKTHPVLEKTLHVLYRQAIPCMIRTSHSLYSVVCMNCTYKVRTIYHTDKARNWQATRDRGPTTGWTRRAQQGNRRRQRLTIYRVEEGGRGLTHLLPQIRVLDPPLRLAPCVCASVCVMSWIHGPARVYVCVGACLWVSEPPNSRAWQCISNVYIQGMVCT